MSDDDARAFLERVLAASATLESINADWAQLDELPEEVRARLHRAIAALSLRDPVARRRRTKAQERERKAARIKKEDRVLAVTGIRSEHRRPVINTPNQLPPPRRFDPQDVTPDVDAPAAAAGDAVEVDERACYICKRKYSTLHHFYDQLCPECAALNFRKRTELADVRGRVALVTGGRVKIGYQAVLKLLRGGARVIVTTRFPNDSSVRFAREADFGDWQHRLEIFGLDLRHTPSVEAFCRDMLATHDRLDFIINNACQTVRRPPAFYAHMMAGERDAMAAGGDSRALVRHIAAAARAPHSAELSQVALLPEEFTGQSDLFPAGQLDQDLQQVDLRGRNSWRLLLDEVSSVELLEVQLVNAVAPFVLNARLKALMMRTPGRDKHIVNVSAVEGQFYRSHKTTRHPHTNMAKAALNMMTRTSAADYHGDGIHMNSVDTGWVTDEDPFEIAARKTAEQRFHPPLDIVDGAARILDPIIDGLNTGTHVWGKFLKDYRAVDW